MPRTTKTSSIWWPPAPPPDNDRGSNAVPGCQDSGERARLPQTGASLATSAQQRCRAGGIVVALLCALSASQAQTVNNSFVVRAVRVFDGEGILPDERDVLVEKGTIVRIATVQQLQAPGLPIVDGRGKTLLPGFIDSHVHVGVTFDPNNPSSALSTVTAEGTAAAIAAALRQEISFGVTTVLDMATAGDALTKLKQIEAADAPDLASVRTAGVTATAAGGHGTQFGGPAFPTLRAPEEATPFVNARIAEGSDHIKIIYDDGGAFDGKPHLPMISKETLTALVKAAHARRKIAVVHVMTERQARDAIEAGADGLAHLFVGQTASPDFGRFVAAHRAFVVPTLSVEYSVCGKAEGPALMSDMRVAPFVRPEWRALLRISLAPAPNRFCDGTEDALHQLLRAHVPIPAGTDSPVPGTTHGAALHGELALLVRAGATPTEALVAATSAAARAFRLSDRGLIRPGMRADLVLVDGDPTRDVTDTRNIVTVWKRGIPVQRERFD